MLSYAGEFADDLFRAWTFSIGDQAIGRQNITGESGFYYLYFVNCDENTVLDLAGEVVW